MPNKIDYMHKLILEWLAGELGLNRPPSFPGTGVGFLKSPDIGNLSFFCDDSRILLSGLPRYLVCSIG